MSKTMSKTFTFVLPTLRYCAGPQPYGLSGRGCVAGGREELSTGQSPAEPGVPHI